MLVYFKKDAKILSPFVKTDVIMEIKKEVRV
jgi:hypothetical protein